MTVATLPAPPADNRLPHERASVSIELVSPALARKWLGVNKHNRNPKKRTQANFVRDMQAGNWLLTGEPVVFDWEGHLIDGQNRLAAIDTSDTPQWMVVVRDIDPIAQHVMDTGSKRSAADMLALIGAQNTAVIAATARLAIYAERNGISAVEGMTPDVTHSEVREFVENDALIQWAATNAMAFRDIPAPTSAIAFSLWLTGQVDAAEARTYHQQLSEMRTSGVGDPRYTVLKRLAQHRDNRDHLRNTQYAFYLVRGWNAVRKNETLDKLQLSRTGRTAMPKPV